MATDKEKFREDMIAAQLLLAAETLAALPNALCDQKWDTDLIPQGDCRRVAVGRWKKGDDDGGFVCEEHARYLEAYVPDAKVERFGTPVLAAPWRNKGVSAVPELGFRRPRTVEEIKKLADVAGEVAFHALKYANAVGVNGEATTILAKAHEDLAKAFCWITKMMWALGPTRK